MALTVNPSSTFTAILENAGSGLAGTVGVRIINAQTEAVALARTTIGIAEAVSGSGVYEVQLTAPAALGEYVIVWDDGGTSPADFASESLTVAGVAPAPTVIPPTGLSQYSMPQRNATLTTISARGVSEDWDRVGTTAAIWTGKADAYLMRTDDRSNPLSADSTSTVTTRVVLIPRLVPVIPGCVVTLVSDDGTTEQISVKTVDRRLPPPGVVAPIRLTGEVA
jgi:hypothetical protein